MSQLWRRRDELHGLGAEVLLVSFEGQRSTERFAAAVESRWPIFVDEPRAAYTAYGLTRASAARVWFSPRTVAFYLRALLRGRRLQRPVADTAQLGGDFVIDRGGRTALAHRSVEPADRPSVESLLDVLRGIA